MTLNYIGSKKTLIPFIEKVIDENISKDDLIFGDLFAGTGIVGQTLSKKFRIISNDIEYYSFVVNNAVLKCSYSEELQKKIDDLNKLEGKKGLISEEYSLLGEKKRMFFTNKNVMKADSIRIKIEELKDSITIHEYYFLLASLLVTLDKLANTTCVYGAYLKKWKKSALKEFILKPIHKNIVREGNIVYNKDIMDIEDKFDIIYLDPPYNSRQYGGNYSPLNYIAKYDKTLKVKGKSGIVDGYFKSMFCRKASAKKEMEELLKRLKTRYLLISYNNEGIIKEKDFKEMLCKLGKVKLYKYSYKRYKSQVNDTKKKVYEYLYFIDKEKTGDLEEIIIKLI
jgi:adenine-specific DNA-methyltransferase